MDKEKYYKKLLELKEKEETELKEMEMELFKMSNRDKSGDLSGYTLHLADLASDAYQQECNVTLIEHKNYILEEIKAALERLEENNFGICEECKRPIEESRLEVLPYARLCLICKSKKEADFYGKIT
jgi:RNA polymerase-binding transcription factor DksA